MTGKPDFTEQDGSWAKKEEDGWFLPRSSVNGIVALKLDQLIADAKQSHICNIILRLNGEDHRREADWVKHMKRTNT